MTESGAALEAARSMLGISLPELWVDYLALGGCAAPAKVAAFLAGELHPDDYDHDLLAHALNERFSDLGDDNPLAYARLLAPKRP